MRETAATLAEQHRLAIEIPCGQAVARCQPVIGRHHHHAAFLRDLPSVQPLGEGCIIWQQRTVEHVVRQHRFGNRRRTAFLEVHRKLGINACQGADLVGNV